MEINRKQIANDYIISLKFRLNMDSIHIKSTYIAVDIIDCN